MPDIDKREKTPIEITIKSCEDDDKSNIILNDGMADSGGAFSFDPSEERWGIQTGCFYETEPNLRIITYALCDTSECEY